MASKDNVLEIRTGPVVIAGSFRVSLFIDLGLP